MFLDGSYAMSQDGYYMVASAADVVTTKKTPLPSSLTEELCGVQSSCLGPPAANGKPTYVNIEGKTVGADGKTVAGTGAAGLPRSFAVPLLLALGVSVASLL